MTSVVSRAQIRDGRNEEKLNNEVQEPVPLEGGPGKKQTPAKKERNGPRRMGLENGTGRGDNARWMAAAGGGPGARVRRQDRAISEGGSWAARRL